MISHLRDSVARVRSEERNGYDQSSLAKGKNAIRVTGVIYAIYCLYSKKVYVGQTHNSAFHRFQQHVRSAVDGENEVFHRAIRKHGRENFAVFPLEVLDPDTYSLSTFRFVANAREYYWIERLHSYAPLGYNTAVRARRRIRRHRINNPLQFQRAKRRISQSGAASPIRLSMPDVPFAMVWIS